jgi:F-type H+-transporting ATPase subunit b
VNWTLALAAETNPHWVAEAVTTVIGFLIFLWVLRRYAWGPITELLDSRRQAIEDQFDKIETLRIEADALEKQYSDKLRDIEVEARKRIHEAVAEGQRVKEEIVARARTESEEVREKQERLLALEVAKARIEMRDEVVQITLAATEKLLGEALDGERHRRLITEFIAGVQRIDTAGDGGRGG